MRQQNATENLNPIELNALERTQRLRFSEQLRELPSIPLAPGTDLTILELTKCKCIPFAGGNAIVRVKVTSGRNEGATGWICETFIGRKHSWF
jgi:hypothetical protein